MELNNGSMESQSKSIFSESWNLSDSVDEEELNVNQVSILAIVAFIIGLLSFVVCLGMKLLFIPILGIPVSCLALYSIHVSGKTRSGRWLALSGLGLSLLFLISALVFNYLYVRQLYYDADQMARLWIQAAKDGNFEELYQLERPYWQRSVDFNRGTFWITRMDDEVAHLYAHRLLANPVILTLNTLKDKAKVTFYRNDRFAMVKSKASFANIYAITCPTAEGNKTFFIRIRVAQELDEDNDNSRMRGWSVKVGPTEPMKIDENGIPIPLDDDVK